MVLASCVPAPIRITRLRTVGDPSDTLAKAFSRLWSGWHDKHNSSSGLPAESRECGMSLARPRSHTTPSSRSQEVRRRSGSTHHQGVVGIAVPGWWAAAVAAAVS